MIRLIYIFFSIFSMQLWAVGQIHYMPRSPYALLMGDAFTARADDNYTLFYNPAALSKNRGVEFYLLNLKLGATNILSERDRFSGLSSDPVVLASELTGVPIFIEAGGIPTLKFGPFGLSLFANFDSSITLRNSTYPYLDVDHRYDRGFSFGYAHTLGSSSLFNRSKKKDGISTTIALAVKHFNREGVRKKYDLFGTSLLSSITSGDISDYGSFKKVLGYSKGDAWGYDIAVEQDFKFGESTLTLALVASDITNTHFTRTEGTSPIPNQDRLITSAVSYQFKQSFFDFSINMDLKPILANISLARKLHLGVDLGIPLLRIMFGMNEGYLSYGAQIKMWPFLLTAGFYGVELGKEYRQLKGRRLIIYLSLLDFSFDA